LPFFKKAAMLPDPLPITDPRMTRLMITIEQGVGLVWTALSDMLGGETYVHKIPSMRITDIAEAIAPGKPMITVGIRPGEKLHEQMIGPEDAPFTYDYGDYYKILPSINSWDQRSDSVRGGVKVPSDFSYDSETNNVWMTIEELREWASSNLDSPNSKLAPSVGLE